MTVVVITNVVFKSPGRQREIFAFFNSSVYQIELNISCYFYCQIGEKSYNRRYHKNKKGDNNGFIK